MNNVYASSIMGELFNLLFWIKYELPIIDQCDRGWQSGEYATVTESIDPDAATVWRYSPSVHTHMVNTRFAIFVVLIEAISHTLMLFGWYNWHRFTNNSTIISTKISTAKPCAYAVNQHLVSMALSVFNRGFYICYWLKTIGAYNIPFHKHIHNTAIVWFCIFDIT